MKTKLLFLLLLLLFVPVYAYERPPNVDQADWEALSPYFLPEDHPIKAQLDEIFADPTSLMTIASLKEKGFRTIKQRPSRMVFASHKKVKEFKFKLFLHSFPLPEWWFFKKRIEGAELIRDAIARHGFQNILKVPKKWIYPLPPCHHRLNMPNPKNFVMIVEDMHVYTNTSNAEYYRSAITKSEIQALFTIIQELRLIDSIYIDNIPRCLDQKFAFIDTEHFLVNDPIPWERLLQALQPKRRDYLLDLIQGQ